MISWFQSSPPTDTSRSLGCYPPFLARNSSFLQRLDPLLRFSLFVPFPPQTHFFHLLAAHLKVILSLLPPGQGSLFRRPFLFTIVRVPFKSFPFVLFPSVFTPPLFLKVHFFCVLAPHFPSPLFIRCVLSLAGICQDSGDILFPLFLLFPLHHTPFEVTMFPFGLAYGPCST